MSIRQLNLGETEFADLITVLQAAEAQALAWVKAKHSTDAERAEAMRRAAICQMAYLQLEGIEHKPASGAPDWAGGACASCRGLAPAARADLIVSKVFCRPCLLRECPIDHRCMKRIDVDTVLQSVAGHLS